VEPNKSLELTPWRLGDTESADCRGSLRVADSAAQLNSMLCGFRSRQRKSSLHPVRHSGLRRPSSIAPGHACFRRLPTWRERSFFERRSRKRRDPPTSFVGLADCRLVTLELTCHRTDCPAIGAGRFGHTQRPAPGELSPGQCLALTAGAWVDSLKWCRRSADSTAS